MDTNTSRDRTSITDPGVRGIVLAVEALDDLFARFDGSPLAQRGISHDADAFVMEHAERIDPGQRIAIRVELPASASACCGDVQSAFRRHFSSAAERYRFALRRHFSRGWKMLGSAVLLALALLLVIQLLADLSDVALIERIASGLSIAAWVTMWRPLEFLIYDWRDMGRSLRTAERLSSIDVECVARAIDPSLHRA